MKKIFGILLLLVTSLMLAQTPYFVPSPWAKIKKVWSTREVPLGVNQDSTWKSIYLASKLYTDSVVTGGTVGGSGTTGKYSKWTALHTLGNALLKDSSNFIVEPSGDIFIGGLGIYSLNLNTGVFRNEASGTTLYDFGNGFLYDNSSRVVISLSDRRLYNSAVHATIDWQANTLISDGGTNRLLWDNTGLKFVLGSDAAGDMRYRNSSGYEQRVGIGSSGKVWTSNGTVPGWADPAGSFWAQTGNSTGSNIFGRLDSTDIIVETNNHERFRVKAKEGVILGVAGTNGQTYLDLNGQRHGGFYVTDDNNDGTGDYMYMAKNNGIDFNLVDVNSHFNVLNQGGGGITIDDQGGGGLGLQSATNNIDFLSSGGKTVHNNMALVGTDYTAQLPNKTGTQTYAMLSDVGGTDSAVVVGYGLSKSVSSTKITLKADTTSGTGSAKLATQYYVNTHAGSGWSLTGNSGTTAGTNFIGTTDSVALYAKTNNQTRLAILANGYGGFGTLRPDTNNNKCFFEFQKNYDGQTWVRNSNYSLGHNALPGFYFATKDTNAALSGTSAYGYVGITGTRALGINGKPMQTLFVSGGSSSGMAMYCDNGDITMNANGSGYGVPGITIKGGHHPFYDGTNNVILGDTTYSPYKLTVWGNSYFNACPMIIGHAAYGTENFLLSKNENAVGQMLLDNQSTGTSAGKSITFQNSGGSATIYFFGSGFVDASSRAALSANALTFINNGGIFNAATSTGHLKYFTGGLYTANMRLDIDNAGYAAFTTTKTTAKTGLTSNTTNCGYRLDTIGFKVTQNQYVGNACTVPFEVDNSTVAMFRIDANENVQINASNNARATNATNGFFYPPSMGGTPTGTPALRRIGAPAMVIDTTNTAIWAYYGGGWNNIAGSARIIANRNEVWGAGAGGSILGAADNVLIGSNAGRITTTSGNIIIGSDAMYYNSIGVHDIAIGLQALNKCDDGLGDVAIGESALTNCVGDYNTSTGYQSGQSTTTGSSNTYYGYHAGNLNTTGSSNTAIGVVALDFCVTSDKNTAIGYASLRNATGEKNTATGAFSSYRQTTGVNNTSNGYNSLEETTSGSGNFGGGNYSGYNNTTGTHNTFAGDSAGISVTTGSTLTLVGYNANSSATLTNATAIGANASVTASNTLVLGSSVNVAIGSTSPTYKLDVTGGDEGLATVGKTYRQHFGSTGDMFGDATLTSGVATITISGLTTADRAFTQVIADGGTVGIRYVAVCTSNTLTITAESAASTTQTLDTSTLTFHILRPY